jgi:dGTPase
VAETPKTSGRGTFERDRARVLHSSALRRLAAKTQVVSVDAGDFPRTRLTHSLECAQIGRELGRTLGCDPDLVDAACLAHDLGHPPFGHNGEAALATVAAGCGGFEGNAQSLRLLTRLETKVPGAGLNLTRATLDATLKYPWLAGKGPAGTSKFGAYEQDAEIFDWIRLGAPPGRLCLEAQVMDWADDVAYSVHDLEDGLQAGQITPAALRDPAQRRTVAGLTLTDYCVPGSVTAAELDEVFTGLLALGCWPRTLDGGPRSMAALKNLTSELIGRFCQTAQAATLATSPGPVPAGPVPAGPVPAGPVPAGPVPAGPVPAGPVPARTRYGADLVVPRTQRLECALLKGVTAIYVMNRPGVARAQSAERELVTELAAAIMMGAPVTLDPLLRPAWQAAGSDQARCRVVVDQVASLTDTSAKAWHRRLCR